MTHHVRRIERGVYQVEVGRASEDNQHWEIVYVAGSATDRWVFWNGHVFRGDYTVSGGSEGDRDGGGRRRRAQAARQVITAPMPARIVQIYVQPGDRVKKGEPIILLEAMKMELPIRAEADATVTSVHSQAGELVQADAVLVELG